MQETHSSSLAARDLSHFLGIDVGTSGIRAILIDENKQVIASSRISLPESRYAGNQAEQDPRCWWDGLITVLSTMRQQTRLDKVQAIAVDGTSATVLLTDSHGNSLHPALMYNDNRASNEAHQLSTLAPPGSPVISASSGLAKLLWLAQQPFAREARYFLHQADWLAGKLAGQFGFSDPNNALKSGYDCINRSWPAWLDTLAFPRAWLPEIHPAGTPITSVAPGIAEQLGLPPSSLIVSGTTDSTASFMATGANTTGEAVTALGSTLVLKVIADTPVTKQTYGIYSQPLGDKWLVGGASNSGGAVLRRFFSDQQMTEMEPALHPVKPTGLNYYPLPGIGERFPINDPAKQPHLTPRPDDDIVFYQGLLEGISSIEQLGYQRLHECGAPWPSSIRTTGRGAHNSAWTQIRSRLLNVPLLTASHTEAAFGAACLARTGLLARNNK